jgi:hypothetical protein
MFYSKMLGLFDISVASAIFFVISYVDVLTCLDLIVQFIPQDAIDVKSQNSICCEILAFQVKERIQFLFHKFKGDITSLAWKKKLSLTLS